MRRIITNICAQTGKYVVEYINYTKTKGENDYDELSSNGKNYESKRGIYR